MSGGPLAALVGEWRGTGHGEFPTMESFDYEEEIRFTDLGMPALVYQQRAWAAADSELLHLETGIWRANPEGLLVVTVALPRVTEISEGAIRDGTIELASGSVGRGSGGAGLVATRRAYQLGGDRITYRIAMATDGVPELTGHLVGELHRAG